MPVRSHAAPFSRFFLFLLFASLPAPAQESGLSISPLIDSLQARLLKNPTDRQAQRSLIDAYTLAFQPELALLEILVSEREQTAANTDPGLKGRIQLSLEQTAPALRSLRQSYLLSPSDETLLLIAILEYARGDAPRGLSLVSRLKRRTPHLSVELLRLYERFYLNGRKLIAGAVGRAIQETDPVAYASYFPLPQITILSPTQFFATEAPQTSVICEVRHSRPIRLVELGEEVIFEQDAPASERADEAFQKNFTHLVSLREGRNDLVVRATDIFGNEKAETVVVNGLNYQRLAEWASPAVDSLRRAVRQLRTYIPDSVLVGEYVPHVRALLIGEGKDGYDGALFWHEFLTDRVTGWTDPSNAKLLVRERVEEQNVSIVMNDWLLKGATFRSISVLYLGGAWQITPDEWRLRDRQGRWVDVKPSLEQLRSLATAGVVLMVDGVSENRQTLESGLRQLAASSSIPVEAILFSSRTDWRRDILRHTLTPGDPPGPEAMTPRSLEGTLSETLVLARSEGSTPFAKNPAGIVGTLYGTMLRDLERKLNRERAPSEIRDKIIAFARDWRRYNEVSRYLENQLSLSDFVIRVDEYQSRRSEGDRGR